MQGKVPSLNSATAHGALLASYRGRLPRRLPRVLASLSGSILFVAIFAWRLYRLIADSLQHGLPAALSWNWQWASAGALGLIVWLVMSLPPVFSRSGSLSLFQNGVLVHYPRRVFVSPSREVFYPWASIQGIAVDAQYTGRPFPEDEIHRTAVITFKEDSPLTLSDHGRGQWVITGLSDLISRLKASLYPRLTPALCSHLQSGNWLEFGPIAIHRQEISLDRGRIPWKSVRRVSLNEGSLVIQWSHQGKNLTQAKIPVKHIPNLELMLDIINQYAEG